MIRYLFGIQLSLRANISAILYSSLFDLSRRSSRLSAIKRSTSCPGNEAFYPCHGYIHESILSLSRMQVKNVGKMFQGISQARGRDVRYSRNTHV